MIVDPNMKAAMLIASAEADDLVRQLSEIKGGKPVVRIFVRLRDEAAEAIAEMVKLNTTGDPAKVARDLMFLQLEARLFRRFIEHCRQIISDGEDADQVVGEKERDELRDLLAGDPDGERLAIKLGLNQEAYDDA